MTHATLPHAMEIRELFLDLLGRPITLTPLPVWLPTESDLPYLVEFVAKGDQTKAIVLLDEPMAVYLAAAIGLLPAPKAEKLLETKELRSSAFFADLAEVMNVLSAVLNVPDSPHVRLGLIHSPGEELPEWVRLLAVRQLARLDVEVEIGGYGSGRLALISA